MGADLMPELIVFLTLAVLCNTVVPISFDPILVFYAASHTLHASCAFAAAGSICAAAAGIADAKLLGHVQRRVSERWLKWLPYWSGRRFYVLTFLFALMPLPFSVVRLALVRHQPRIAPYAAAILLGRLPRYILIVVFMRSL